jgi:hypothetical protein
LPSYASGAVFQPVRFSGSSIHQFNNEYGKWSADETSFFRGRRTQGSGRFEAHAADAGIFVGDWLCEQWEIGARSDDGKTVRRDVSDIRMPEMDGAALLKIVCERFPGAVRIVVCSQEEMTERAAIEMRDGPKRETRRAMETSKK